MRHWKSWTESENAYIDYVDNDNNGQVRIVDRVQLEEFDVDRAFNVHRTGP